MQIDWEKHHRFMPYPGWCGPTTIWMALSACGIKKNINKVARDVWKKWYGAPPQLMAAYLARYFGEVGYEVNCKIEDISTNLKKGRIVIVNWQDNGEGHYSIVADMGDNWIQMVDSSREHPWLYFINPYVFRKIWFDYLADNKRIRHDGLLIWVDPASSKKLDDMD